jgi:hypothetical protein
MKEMTEKFDLNERQLAEIKFEDDRLVMAHAWR